MASDVIQIFCRFNVPAAICFKNNIMTNNIMTNNIMTNNIMTNNIMTNNIMTNNIMTNNIITNKNLSPYILRLIDWPKPSPRSHKS